ncbi:MAG: hypothetical protein HOL05_04090 [Nitrospinaceae bacterium]|nr:hypothetical protein [Nitrospinaceae bacterium]
MKIPTWEKLLGQVASDNVNQSSTDGEIYFLGRALSHLALPTLGPLD